MRIDIFYVVLPSRALGPNSQRAGVLLSGIHEKLSYAQILFLCYNRLKPAKKDGKLT